MKAPSLQLGRLNLYKLTAWLIENEKQLYEARLTRAAVARRAEEALGFRLNESHVNDVVKTHELGISATRSAPKTFNKSVFEKETAARLDALENKVDGVQVNNDLNLKAIDKAIEDIQDKLRRLENNLPGAFDKLAPKNVQFPLRGI